jgi:MoaA/NifB/PqqE/SkfB family radical SAM enzyme
MFMGNHGGPCDKKCQMCYYAHQKKLVFYSLETLMKHANIMRHYYSLDACDISGGEATIYKTKTGDIVDLVRHCASIGLRPTIISHGQNNHDGWKLGHERPLHQLVEEAGLDDWLISLHGGSAKTHDEILCQEGSFDRLVANLDNVERPVRFNSTIQVQNYQDFPVNVLKDRPPTVWNPIMFNPFHYWADKTRQEIDFQVEYHKAAPYLAKAIEELEALDWEVNVRYWPMCIAEEYGFAQNVCGYHQVSFDPWEWRLCVTHRLPMEKIEEAGGWYKAERAAATELMGHRDNIRCGACVWRFVCDKPPEQYQAKYGLDELSPVTKGETLSDPLHFQKREKHRSLRVAT